MFLRGCWDDLGSLKAFLKDPIQMLSNGKRKKKTILIIHPQLDAVLSAIKIYLFRDDILILFLILLLSTPISFAIFSSVNC